MADDVLRIARYERIALLTLNRPDRLHALHVELAMLSGWPEPLRT